MAISAFVLPSFAKINWNLRVLGQRPDGYHEVRTVLQTVSLHDEIELASRVDDRIVLSCDDPGIETGHANLITRAGRALQDRFRTSQGATISLKKRIPIKAGLGGGSSNAAITVLGLAHLWGLAAGLDELMAIGATIGTDVPFFFVGGRALATGTGSTVRQQSSSPPKHLLIIKPKAAVSTLEAYSALRSSRLTTENAASILSSPRENGGPVDSDLTLLDEQLVNDFEKVIFDIEPEIGRARDALLQAGARGALLAGSGSSVFGIFDSPQAQQRAVRELQAEVGWLSLPCVTLSREEYLVALSSLRLLRSFDPGIDTGA
ncbi:MAG TPA: 4-(cytidine 5'-diphospho)-2-C-methyl-D-erythritol kinase [Pyrinomonadaceae bacterium]|nr:4-(cytidine 5'-diphospho)-2-C-methyl-D-erythritol kinase [Pyrinomonadaceae bacterium]